MVQPNVHLSSSRWVKHPFCRSTKAHSVAIEAFAIFRHLKVYPAVLFKYHNETTIKNVNELEPNQSQHIPVKTSLEANWSAIKLSRRHT